jgi:hypothetical protein
MDESCGTENREWLCWRRPVATVNYRPVLLSDGRPTTTYPQASEVTEIWLLAIDVCLTLRDWSTNRPSQRTSRKKLKNEVDVEVEVEVILRPTVSRSISLGVRHPSGTCYQFFFLLEIFFRQLRVCYFVAPSLTRGRVCNLLLLLVLASAVPLGSESRGNQDHTLLSQFLRLPQSGGPSPRIYIPQEQGGPDIPQDIGFPFRHLLRLAGLRWRHSIPPPHGIKITNFF